MLTIDTTLEELLIRAKETVEEVQTGEIFLLKDLFRGFEWNRIKINNRTKLGMLFSSYVETSTKVEMIGKTPQNQFKYKKL